MPISTGLRIYSRQLSKAEPGTTQLRLELLSATVTIHHVIDVTTKSIVPIIRTRAVVPSPEGMGPIEFESPLTGNSAQIDW